MWGKLLSADDLVVKDVLMIPITIVTKYYKSAGSILMGTKTITIDNINANHWAMVCIIIMCIMGYIVVLMTSSHVPRTAYTIDLSQAHGDTSPNAV